MILFFDTETTGLADDSGDEISSCNIIVRPDGFSIPEEATEKHGISHAQALAVGVPLHFALGMFAKWVAVSELLSGLQRGF